MSADREFELKYGVADDGVAAVAAALEAAGASRQVLEARYFDTVDGRLFEAGVALRLRRSPRGWEQTLKAPGPRRWDRLEHSVPAAAGRGRDVPDLDPQRHSGSAAAKALRRAMADGAGSTLTERFTTLVDRLAVEIDDGRGQVEVAFDRGRVCAGDAVEDLREIEYEWKGGDRAAVLDLARRGVGEHGLWLSTPSKSQRGERLARADSIAATPTRAPRLARSMRGGEVARCVVAACFEQIAANQSTLAAGVGHDESVHQLRVGLRRLRTVARELAGLDDALAALSTAAVTATFRTLGQARDQSHVVPRLHARLRAAGSPAPELAGPEATAARVDATAAVRDPAFQLALLDWIAYIEQLTPRPVGGEADRDGSSADAVKPYVARRLARLRKRIGRVANRFERLDSDAQHEVRKVLKRLRYLVEAVGTLFAKRRVDRYLKRVKPAQDALGEHVDLIVGLDLARTLQAAGVGGAAFNVGWLEAQLAASGVACRRALIAVVDAEPFWRK